ncbi:hypothetical protein AYI68_g7026 [Smittium mucronatum]|uniref:Uncharacterized protein n=1 Tax=Smittium mucronatum TaxID=133383 RepID=A0A1R0GPU7_9FUNG|nr:hypothetical protein AYI68_g7026 [Smittium mucronatum]
MGEEERDPDFCLPGRPPNNRRVEGEMHGKYRNNVFQACRARIHNQFGEVIHKTISIYNPLWNDIQFTGIVPESPLYQYPGYPPRGYELLNTGKTTLRCLSSLIGKAQPIIEESIAVESEVLDVDNNTYQRSDIEPTLLEAPGEVMECPVVSSRDYRYGSLYRCQRHILGDNCGLTYLFRLVNTYQGIDAYRC